MAAPDNIRQLVERFDQHREAYRSGRYNETQLRREFLDPFFEALEWDVFNRLGYSEENKHVIHEDSLEIEGVKKAPDYAFKIGKERKFFVEAKKPSVKIETNPEFAFQLRRYVWSAKLPLGILTDFEEFAVYECRSKPQVSDSVRTGRVLLLKYTDYIEKWEEIASIFSYEAVMQGGFDIFANTAIKKKGTAEVDAAFLDEIEGWRETLAKNIALRNRTQVRSEADLNYAVQMTIDRIIFLRICEDRGFESENQLQNVARHEGIYDELKKLLDKADRRYNSGLFHFKEEKGRGRADTFTTGLEIDDKVLKDIIRDLYYPSPYVFSQIPADILGQIYEQFLGKVIRLTAGGNVKVEEKPEVRKAGGVFYTPTFIVDYIVSNTLGKLLQGKTPAQAALLKIVDPACGSGTFLLGAYQYLLDWHLNWYLNNDFEKWSKGKNAVLVQGRDGWKLKVEKKKEILLNNIYGVDIDPQAVEVTKLSLLLKVIEDPGQLSYLDERILPDLGKNIQCGNSLIGPDYWEGQLLVSEEDRTRVNAFDWKQAFPEVFAQGGFDAVMGNPPYVRSINLKESDPLLWNIYRNKYESASEREWDIYLIFVEKGITLLKRGGLLGYILPNKFLNSQVGANLRDLLSSGHWLRNIVHFGAFQIFEGVTTYTCLLFLGQNSAITTIDVSRYIGDVSKSSHQCAMPDEAPKLWTTYKIEEDSLSSSSWEFSTSNSGLMDKIRKFPKLQDVARVYQGTGTRADKVFAFKAISNESGSYQVYSQETEKEYVLETEFLRPALKGRDIGRYGLNNKDTLLLVPYEIKDNKILLVPEKTLSTRAPKTVDYLLECQPRLNERENGRFKGEGWYCYGRPQNMDKFEIPEKIVLPDIANRGQCYLDTEGRWILDTAYAIVPLLKQKLDIRYLLGILNSPLLTHFLKETGTALRGGYFRMKTAYLNPFPIRSINFSDFADKARHDKMVSLVERMLALHKSLASAHNPQAADRLSREVESTDRQIDNLVYELYGLTEEEIKIVES